MYVGRLQMRAGKGKRVRRPQHLTARRSTAARSAIDHKTKRRVRQVRRAMRDGARWSVFTALALNFAVDPWRRLRVRPSYAGSPHRAVPRVRADATSAVARVPALAPIACACAWACSLVTVPTLVPVLVSCPCPNRVRESATVNWPFKSMDVRKWTFQLPNGKRLSDAPPKLAKRTEADGVG